MSGPRTFGDLLAMRVLHKSCRCTFCKGYQGARKYSTRHYICDSCITTRKDVLLPSVKRHEAFQRRLDALGQKRSAQP